MLKNKEIVLSAAGVGEDDQNNKLQDPQICAVWTTPVESSDSRLPANETCEIPTQALEQRANTPAGSTDYDPYANRKVKHPIKYREAVFHIFSSYVATGILALPIGFMHAGYVVGTVLTVTTGAITIYCIHMLVRSSFRVCQRTQVPSITYATLAKKAFESGPVVSKRIAPYTTHIVNYFLVLSHLGPCCVYYVFINETLHSLTVYYMDYDIDVRLYMLLMLPVFILLNMVRRLHVLARLSGVANVVTVTCLAVIFYYLLREDLVPLTRRHSVGTVNSVLLYLGVLLFAAGAIGVVLPIENNIKRPKDMQGPMGLINISMIPITGLYICMGFFGYLRFGTLTKSNITLNLPADELLAQGVKVLLSIAILIAYTVQFYIAVEVVWSYLSPHLKTRVLLWEYVTRVILVIITCILAIAIPHLHLFMSLVGSVSRSSLSIIFPACIQLSAFWFDYKRFRFAIFFMKNAFIIIIAGVASVACTIVVIIEIIELYS